jgi:hypothetical protein
MPTITAHFGSKLGFIYISTAVRAVNFNGVARLKLTVFY